ncbi:hypothetical protein Lfee_2025 [Legionella feeleii]|uniref:Uncharacterized protein n=2 Tax=Legionella feeleii TaxID=453 RepID=A0A0W0TKU4_9GAMM|nr:hypothetical protein Lfee_2025 [Legionella feeleii]SPX61006.1 Uncharacterised protein [Legionella feeleii]
MTKLINPIFEKTDEELLKFATQRFFTMFTPIQKTKTKQSDFVAFVANPFIDTYLEPMFALDATIHLANAIASLAKGFYTWSLNQQKTTSLLDEESAQEFGEAWESAYHAGSMMIAESLGALFSIISLFTRPVASIVQAIADESSSYSPGYR